MSVLTESGRIAIAEAIKEQPLHLAWGEGDGAWTTPTAEDVSATALISEVGRRAIFEKRFCTPDVNGEIIVPTGRFTFSDATPTNNLYLSFKFDFTDASDKVIRELGVFSSTVLDGGLPGGQLYFTGSDVTDPGILLLLEHTAPIHRNAATRETFEFVITF